MVDRREVFVKYFAAIFKEIFKKTHHVLFPLTIVHGFFW